MNFPVSTNWTIECLKDLICRDNSIIQWAKDKEYVMKQNLRQPTKQSSSFSSRVNLSFVLDIWHSFHPIREQIEALQLWNMIMLLLSTRQVTTSKLQWHILKRRKRLRDDESNNNAVHSRQNGESEEFRSNFTD